MGLFLGSNDLGTLGLGLLIAGMVSGLVTGLLGMGGGIVIVPVLYHVLGAAGVAESVRMPLTVGTSLAAIVPTALWSLASTKTAIDWPLLKRWAAPMLLGVAAGAVLAAKAPGPWLVLLFAAVGLAAAVHLAFGEGWRLAARPSSGVIGGAVAFVIGGLSAMIGIGGRVLGVPALTLCGVPRPRAIGTASGLAVIVSGAGALAALIAGWGASGLPAYSYGYVNLLGFGIIAPLAFAAAAVAGHYADLVETRRLRGLFALFVVLTTAKMVWDVWG